MLTMYSTSWCGYCHRLKSQLDRAGIGYEVVDIEADPEAAAFVEGVNGGNQTVPTVRIVPPPAGRDRHDEPDDQAGSGSSRVRPPSPDQQLNRP